MKLDINDKIFIRDMLNIIDGSDWLTKFDRERVENLMDRLQDDIQEFYIKAEDKTPFQEEIEEEIRQDDELVKMLPIGWKKVE